MKTLVSNPLTPVEPPFTAPIAEALESYPRLADGSLLQLFRVFAHSQRFVSGKGVVNLLDAESPLSLRQREIVILRVTAHHRCEYEWGVHVMVFAKAAGLSDAQVEATVLETPQAPCWSEEEQLLLECVDQLAVGANLEAGVLDLFQQQWNQEQQLEILALCANYYLVSLVANVASLTGEPGTPAFPVSAEAG